MKYKLMTPAAAAALEADLWSYYQTREWLARGLPPGSSLDTRDGVPVPAVTTRYAETTVVPGVGVLVHVDDLVSSWNGGRVGAKTLVTSDAVEKTALPKSCQDALDPKETGRGSK